MAKRNEVGRPSDLRAAGNLRVNIEDYDGYISFGREQYRLTTKWQPLGRRARVYNDPQGIAGVAVLREFDDWTKIPQRQLLDLNYTSRTRDVSPGELVVFLNEEGYLLVVLFVESSVDGPDNQTVSLAYYILKPSGEPVRPFEVRLDQNGKEYLWTGDQVFLTDEEGRLLTDDTGALLVAEDETDVLHTMHDSAPDLGTSPDEGPRVVEQVDIFDLYGLNRGDLSNAVQEAIEALEQASAVDFHELGLVRPGHNNPPPDVLLDDLVKREVVEALRRVNGDPASSDDPAMLKQALGKIQSTAAEMFAWAAPELRSGAASGLRKGAELVVLTPVIAAVGTAGVLLLRVLDIAQKIWSHVL